MEDVHAIFTRFKAEFPDIYARNEALGQEIHRHGGPLDDQSRVLVKVAVAAATQHHRALETHLRAAQEAGVAREAVAHALLLIVPTCGFPTFMEAYQVLNGFWDGGDGA